MRRLIIGLLIFGNIISVQFYNISHHSNQNFALCGNSYGENDNKSVEEATNIIDIRRNQIKSSQSKDSIKEIYSEVNDHLFIVKHKLDLKQYHSNSYLLSMEKIQVDNLFISSIFKPS